MFLEQDWQGIRVLLPDRVREYVARQQPSRPQFVWIAEALWFEAGKIDNESSRFFRDNALTSWTRTVVESSYDAEPFGPP
ncbi:hypothetical protein [Methylocystis suflitae]|uniref:hypothetical protein n=1 Tax=Methylocystis suflitae TaxID=2951405 RepID=UPI00210A7412|nr:hypothetical protein [Methylocystis suflitae]MCQ4190004.1 hypothetical protein [Methylocystis suflitae]